MLFSCNGRARPTPGMYTNNPGVDMNVDAARLSVRHKAAASR
jgi:hypothetical protein